MAIGAGTPTNEHGYTLNDDYSPVIAEARAVFEQFDFAGYSDSFAGSRRSQASEVEQKA